MGLSGILSLNGENSMKNSHVHKKKLLPFKKITQPKMTPEVPVKNYAEYQKEALARGDITKEDVVYNHGMGTAEGKQTQKKQYHASFGF